MEEKVSLEKIFKLAGGEEANKDPTKYLKDLMNTLMQIRKRKTKRENSCASWEYCGLP